MGWTPPVTHAIGLVDAADWNDEITENMKCIITTGSTTVAQLNTKWGGSAPPDGAIGRIKAGATPYDFVDVRYDTDLAKWVSAEVWIPLQSSPWAVTGQALSTDVVVGNTLPLPLIPWKVMSTAGLSPQARLQGLLHSVATGTNTSNSATPIIYGANLADTAVGANPLNAASGVTAISAGSTVLYQSAWAGFSGTVYDFLSPAVVMNQVGTGSAQFSAASVTYGLRWVG